MIDNYCTIMFICVCFLSDGDAIHVKMPIILLKFCKEIASGMEYLNGKKFIHRDLAARNVLLSTELICKVLHRD